MHKKSYWVYIMGGMGRTIYVGVTNDLMRRVSEHKAGTVAGFTSRYNLDTLLYFLEFSDPREAIAYEKQIKGWVRQKKDDLIDGMNSQRRDLSGDWLIDNK